MEGRAEVAEREVKRVRAELLETKEELSNAVEQIEKFQGNLDELQEIINVRKKAIAVQVCLLALSLRMCNCIVSLYMMRHGFFSSYTVRPLLSADLDYPQFLALKSTPPKYRGY